MSKINDGGPAFPVTAGNSVFATGMTLRDYFAGQFLSMGSNTTDEPLHVDGDASQDDIDVALREYWRAVARAAYIAADEFIAARSAVASPAGEAIQPASNPVAGQPKLIADKVRDIIVCVLGDRPEPIKDYDLLTADLHADSLDLVEIVMQIEEEFGIEIREDEINIDVSVGEVIAYVEKSMGGQNG